MTVLLGDRRRFAAEVGEREHALRRVDLWAAGQWLTCDDNMAFVPQFRRDVRDTAARLRSGQGAPGAGDDGSEADCEAHARCQPLLWGPTTDNVIACLFRENDRLVITVRFWREDHLRTHPEHAGEVFVAEIPAAEFIDILEDLSTALDGA